MGKRMLFKVIWAVLPVLIVFSGCTKGVRISIEEAVEAQAKHISEQKIVSVRTPGFTAVFDSAGGYYDSRTKSVVGIDMSGNERRISLFDLSEIVVLKTEEDGDSLAHLNRAGAKRYFRKSYLDKIRKVETIGGDSVLQYSKPYGWLHLGHKKLVGVLKGEEKSRISFNDIEYVWVEKPDRPKSFLALLGVAAAGLAGVAVLFSLTWN